MTADDFATDWRSRQRDTLQQLEYQGTPAAMLLEMGRDHIAGRLADAVYGDVPAPPRVTGGLGSWERGSAGGWSRSVSWATFGDVEICGRQQHDGSTTRGVCVWIAEGAELDAAGARRLAGELLAAADTLDDEIST